jgi:hypothetical protein
MVVVNFIFRKIPESGKALVSPVETLLYWNLTGLANDVLPSNILITINVNIALSGRGCQEEYPWETGSFSAW